MTQLAPEDSNFSMVELNRVECLDLLDHARIGRVVLSVKCIPVALPVNACVIDGGVVFATDAGSKLDAAIQGTVVSVEFDDIDRIYHTGWSVLVTGVAEVLTDPGDIARARQLPIQPWAPGPHLFFVRVPSTVVSGRRIEWRTSPRSHV
ncbi:MAG TPA: pyridoxamine 5'-phosphate oxidase family protein [Acidimicrobiales bacterium]|nr:pyridoxamine 5'-phosphate oxidase family protein [Acidimicrobiales bacterium]